MDALLFDAALCIHRKIEKARKHETLPLASHLSDMIAGNPKAGRMMVTLSLALLVLAVVTTAFVAFRKRTSPQKQPPLPLHPSSLVVRSLDCELSTWGNFPQLRERLGRIG
jgi:hypothetical protein